MNKELDDYAYKNRMNNFRHHSGAYYVISGSGEKIKAEFYLTPRKAIEEVDRLKESNIAVIMGEVPTNEIDIEECRIGPITKEDIPKIIDAQQRMALRRY